MPRSKTYFAKPSDVTQNTQVMDATGQVLGRLATRVARTLQGKDKPTYTPFVIVGDRVVVTNAANVRVTGRKPVLKMYYRHSGYVGNLRSMPLKDMMERHPERVIQLAVKGMLPRTTLGRDMLRRLRVYRGDAPGAASPETPSQESK
jgi:large subunit ribosomal protein L13